MKTDSQIKGQQNERKIEEIYRKQGFTVLNLHEKGFPDLLLLKDGKIEAFIEVKGGSHKVHDFQARIHRKLEDLGFKVQVDRV